jgi:hypothetical protein
MIVWLDQARRYFRAVLEIDAAPLIDGASCSERHFDISFANHSGTVSAPPLVGAFFLRGSPRRVLQNIHQAVPHLGP